MLRILLLFVFWLMVGRAVWRLLFGIFQGMQPAMPAGSGGRREKQIGALVKDPVCGTYVAAAQALSLQAGGTTYYFCSEDCRSTYRRR